jgi:shikimate kinase
MGCGKTTLGRNLAKLLKVRFVDLDKMVEESSGISVSAIFAQRGELEFRKEEYAQLKKAVGFPPCVISLGGGTTLYPPNIELIQAAGVLCYIRLPATELAHRLNGFQRKRPLIRDYTGNALLLRIRELLRRRKPGYSKADIVVNGLNLNATSLKAALFAEL